MDKFAKAIKVETNKTLTENLQPAYKSTAYSKVLDLYGVAGALRTRTEDEIKTKMAEAFEEDALLATRLLFYLGDVREGLGERRTFRIALEWLAKNHPGVVRANLSLIPHYNRWDSIFVLKGTAVEQEMIALVDSQLREDITNASREEPISLLAKWLPSANASSSATRALGRWFAQKLGFTEREYRITLSFLRDHLKVVETRMSAKEWHNIDYSQVPSVAMNRYRKAFYAQDGERFGSFLHQVEKGEAKINAGTLYPYNIVEKLMYDRDSSGCEVLEAQWKALPNYVDGGHNVMVMADVSGSMGGRPMATSVGLAIYFAERNKGPYHNLFMTFSHNPQFVQLSGHNLAERIRNAKMANWEMNTDLNIAFSKILRLAVENKLSNNDLPRALVIISDMEIDQASYASRDFTTLQREKFAHYGYDLPKVIYWNVESRKDTFLADGNRPGVQLASGQSASVFRNILHSIATTPYEAMLEVLCGERYDSVVIPESYMSPENVKATETPVAVKSPQRTPEEIRNRRADIVKGLFS